MLSASMSAKPLMTKGANYQCLLAAAVPFEASVVVLFLFPQKKKNKKKTRGLVPPC